MEKDSKSYVCISKAYKVQEGAQQKKIHTERKEKQNTKVSPKA